MIRTNLLGDFGEWWDQGSDEWPWDRETDDKGRVAPRLARYRHTETQHEPRVGRTRDDEWSRDEILTILFPNGRTSADIAAELGRTVGAVRSKRLHLRMDLQNHLDRTADSE